MAKSRRPGSVGPLGLLFAALALTGGLWLSTSDGTVVDPMLKVVGVAAPAQGESVALPGLELAASRTEVEPTATLAVRVTRKKFLSLIHI